MERGPPRFPLFPYTTLFRSLLKGGDCLKLAQDMGAHRVLVKPFTEAEFMEAVNYCVSPRSEEHTSELQSRLHLVCRLLPEKKNPQKLVHSRCQRLDASFVVD